MKLEPPKLKHFCTLEVEVDRPVDVGAGRFGVRRMVAIKGGKVSGPGIFGRVRPGGADWQTINADGITELRANYTFETDDGALIEILNSGIRYASEDVQARLAAGEIVEPNEYYMRTYAMLQTSQPDYAWINRTMFCGTGARTTTGVQIDLFAIE